MAVEEKGSEICFMMVVVKEVYICVRIASQEQFFASLG